MQTNNNRTDQNNTPETSEKEELLFSENETKSIVKGFISGYISGRVTINFPTPSEIECMASALDMPEVRTLDEKSKKTAIELALFKARQKVPDLIAICCGTKPASVSEQKKAFNDLFELILAYRTSGRILGEFLNYDIAERVMKLEEGIEKINNLLKQLVEIHSNEMGF
jgi:hypothetical protein